MNVGLFFGSFNPVHIGHLIITEYMSMHLDEIWLVLSPQSPFKKRSNLLDTRQRLDMLKLAIGKNEKIKISEVELELPIPSYTIDTLTHLKKTHPKTNFSLIMGADNILGIHKWKSAEEILTHDIYIYPRMGYEVDNEIKRNLNENVHFTDAPIIELSATYIRESIAVDKPIKYMLHPNVWTYIQANKLYQQTEKNQK